jgi:hypothetical protein
LGFCFRIRWLRSSNSPALDFGGLCTGEFPRSMGGRRLRRFWRADKANWLVFETATA